MKTKLSEEQQCRMEERDGILCIVVDMPFSGAESEASSPRMREWFRVEEPDADPATIAGRPVRNIDPKEGLFVDEEGSSYRLAGGSKAEPFYAEVITAEGGTGTGSKGGAPQMPIKQSGVNGFPVTGRRRQKKGKPKASLRTVRFQNGRAGRS